MARGRAGKVEGKEPLSAERIELAALELIEDEGMAAFSTRKLATKLGREAMSIYHYFPSKGHLMDALIDHVIAEIPSLPDASLSWIERVRRTGWDIRAAFTKRPNLFLFVGTHRMNTPKALTFLERFIQLFEESGLPEEVAVRLFRSVSYYIMGTALDETAGYARGPSTVEPVPDEVMQRDYPSVTRAGKYFSRADFDKTFGTGWEAMLAGIEELRRRHGVTDRKA
jgi:AcrR family transcriptional regulator